MALLNFRIHSQPENQFSDRSGRCLVGAGARGFTLILLVSCIAGLTFFAVPAREASAQNEVIDRRHKPMAAFLFQFGRYTEWPVNAASNETFVIGIVGKSSIDDVMETIAKQKKVHDKKIVIRHFTDPKNYRPCHILFIPAGQKRAVTQAILERVGNSPVLVVGESPAIMQQGGMISFYLQDKKVKFQISPEAVAQADLKISSKVINLGKIVRTQNTSK